MNRTLPIILAVALFMENMDSTVISTSLPAIALDIGASPVALKLALTAYLVSLAIFIPISSWMADRFGAKLVFRSAIAVFVAGSICCAISGSLAAFVLARFFQGMGGAMMTPIARLVLVRATPKRELVSAMAWLTIPGLIGPMVGPPVGGFITTYFTWHWIFLINVPIGALGIAMAGRVLPKIEPVGAAPVDAIGFVLSAVAASGVVFGLSVVSLPALPPAVGFATLLVGICSGILYIRHARRAANPLLNLNLFRNRVFRASITGGSIFRVGSGATPFLLPLMFQLAFGMTPFQSGMLTFVSAIGAIAMKFLAPVTLRTGGFRNVLAFSTIVGGMFIAANALFTPQTPPGAIIGVLLGAGFLRSLFFTSANALVFAEVEAEEVSQATAISAVSQQISIALGVAVAGGLLEASTLVTASPVSLTSFSIAFTVVGMIAASAAIPFLALPSDAGSSVSGHGAQAAEEGQPPQAL